MLRIRFCVTRSQLFSVKRRPRIFEDRSMWGTDTYWFDVAIATTVLMLGHLYFGRFEEHRPRWRRLLKSVLVVAIIVGITALAGRVWMFAFLGVTAVGVLIIHAWWLPR